MLYFIGNPARQIYVGRSFKDDNGVTYARQWYTILSAAEKSAIGITEQAPPPVYDTRFYDTSGNPENLVSTKARAIQTCRSQAHFLLGGTDWYVIRKAEIGTDLPTNVSTYRNGVRTICDAREALINSATSIAELETVFNGLDTSQPWPAGIPMAAGF